MKMVETISIMAEVSHPFHGWIYGAAQRFSSGVLQESLKHAIPHYLVRGTALLPFRMSNKKQ